MTDLNFGIRFTAEGGGMRGEIRLSKEQMDKLNGTMRAAGATADRTRTKTSRLGDTFKRLNRDVIGLSGALRGLGVGLAIREVTQASLEWEKYERTLKAVTGSQEAADRELEFATTLSNRLGIAVTGLAKDWAQFSAAARGTRLEGAQAREVFVAVAEASRVLGLSGAETTGALRALQQMMSKGTVQAEELRGQLGERLPGAFQIAARAMGVTTMELGKMLEGGEVLAEDLLPRLGQQLREEFGGAVEEASKSAAANFGRFETSVFMLKQQIGDGLLPAMTSFTDYLSQSAIPAIGHWLEVLGVVDTKITGLSLEETQLKLARLTEELRTLNGLSDAGLVGNQGAVDERRRQLTKDLAALDDRRNRLQARLEARIGTGDPNRPPPVIRITGGTEGDGAGGGGGSTTAKARKLNDTERLAIALFKQGEKARRDAAKETERLGEATRDLHDRLDPMVRITRQLVADTKLLADAEREGIITTADRASSMKALRTEFLESGKALREDYNVALKENERFSIDVKGAAQDLGLTFESAFEAAIVQGASFRDVLKGISQDIARIVTRKTITEPLGNALTGSLEGGLGALVKNVFGGTPQAPTSGPPVGFGQALGAAVFHGGGLVGGSAAMRLASPAAFLGAPRMHTGGLAGDEVPAILQRGEEVLTRGDPRHRSNAGGAVVVNYAPNITAIDTRNAGQFLAENQKTLVGLVTDAFNRRGRAGPA